MAADRRYFTVVGGASRYQVLWAHGKGGLGEVYLAEDSELHRRVALKEIQPKHAQDQVSRERFIAEAEITGNLEHPGIVPVYGLGTYHDGRPFYTMRFIKGEDLTTAIRRFHAGTLPNFTGLEFRWLLRKLVDVCNTVAYAHSRGVLHRDLKPGNIMIGPFGETLVMDWGVAKLFGRNEGSAERDTSTLTASGEPAIRCESPNGSATIEGQAVGTPAYMSPEQAAGALDALGPASDVYSLGATLYVMLTDRRPFEGDVKEVLQNVRDGRWLPPRHLKPRVPKALDAICRRAMAREPRERYGSAAAMAGDIERWLADEPVAAWREPWPDQARRWVRRHQPLMAGWVAAIAVAVVALALAVPLLSLAWRNEWAARRDERQQRILALSKASEAQSNAIKATEEKDRAEKALRFLVDTFRKPDPSIDGRTLKVVDLLDHAVKDLDPSFSDQPLMKATLLSAIGETFSGLGMHTESLAAFKRALYVRRESLGEDHPDTLNSMNHLAMAYQGGGQLNASIELYVKVLAKLRTKLSDDHPTTLSAMSGLARSYQLACQIDPAIMLFESTRAGRRAKLGRDHPDTLLTTVDLARAYAAAGRNDKAIPLACEFVQTIARLEDSLPDSVLAAIPQATKLLEIASEHGARP
jgi:serine/threonine protein kinase